MSLQLEKVDDNIKAYFKILSDDMPNFLYEYIKVPEMQRIGYIGMNCGIPECHHDVLIHEPSSVHTDSQFDHVLFYRDN